jgi:putative iron-dependent peroxidase
MATCQLAILEAVPRVGRYLFFSVASALAADIRQSLARLAGLTDGANVLVGVGPELVSLLGAQVPGLHAFKALSGVGGADVPSTPVALCCWLRGDDQGDLLHLTRQLQKALAPALQLDKVVDAFHHGSGRDLTGYEDGTENPQGDAALAAALLQGAGAGLDGSSFMAVQQWQHDLDAFEAISPLAQDHMMGRRRTDNEELDDAPESAHVKRTAQESFDPEAFVLRRSMPWAAGTQCGLMFVAFGRSLDAFEAQMHRMAGLDDGVVDALFGMSKPLTGVHFWCPPMRDGRLDWRQLGL